MKPHLYAAIGGVVGLGLAVLIVPTCTTILGEPRDLGVAMWLGFGTVWAGIIGGAIAGYSFGKRKK